VIPSVQFPARAGRVLAVVLAATLLCGCGLIRGKASPTADATGGSGSQALSGLVTINIQDNKFNPPEITVKAGTKISWINRDPVFHSVRSDTDIFQSGMLAVGQLFTYTFDTPGRYPYYSENSGGPGGEGMSGVIIVVA
jgi:plastocyanin